MYLIAIAWMYVVLMMALAEALSSQGSVVGAFFTVVLYGLLPLGILLYILGTPLRRRARQAALQAEPAAAVPSAQPDGSSMAPGDAVTPVGKEV